MSKCRRLHETAKAGLRWGDDKRVGGSSLLLAEFAWDSPPRSALLWRRGAPWWRRGSPESLDTPALVADADVGARPGGIFQEALWAGLRY